MRVAHKLMGGGRRDSAFLEWVMNAAEARPEFLRRETEEAETTRRGMLQLTPQVLGGGGTSRASRKGCGVG